MGLPHGNNFQRVWTTAQDAVQLPSPGSLWSGVYSLRLDRLHISQMSADFSEIEDVNRCTIFWPQTANKVDTSCQNPSVLKRPCWRDLL